MHVHCIPKGKCWGCKGQVWWAAPNKGKLKFSNTSIQILILKYTIHLLWAAPNKGKLKFSNTQILQHKYFKLPRKRWTQMLLFLCLLFSTIILCGILIIPIFILINLLIIMIILTTRILSQDPSHGALWDLNQPYPQLYHESYPHQPPDPDSDPDPDPGHQDLDDKPIPPVALCGNKVDLPDERAVPRLDQDDDQEENYNKGFLNKN